MISAPRSEPDSPVDPSGIARRITRLSVGVAVILIVIKAFALGASGSVSILASLTDSTLDLVASLATFFAVRWAAGPADQDHRYGRGKGEAMAALVQAGLIFASAVFIGWEAVQRVFDPRPVTAGGWAVGVMLVSIALTSALVWMQTRALKASPSMAVQGDRSHYAADIAANVVVLIGVISGSFLFAPGLDAAAGLVVAVWLFWGATGLLKTASDQLLDRSIPEAERRAITNAVLADPRITGVHNLRTRTAGVVTMVQMHIDLHPTLTLEAAHAIVVEAEDRIRQVAPGADVLIHPDPRGTADAGETARPETPGAGQPDAVVPGPWSEGAR